MYFTKYFYIFIGDCNAYKEAGRTIKQKIVEETQTKLNKATKTLKEVTENYQKITQEYNTLLGHFQQTTNELRKCGEKAEKNKREFEKVITDQKKKIDEHQCGSGVSEDEMMQKLKEKDEKFNIEKEFLVSEFVNEKLALIQEHKKQMNDVSAENVKIQTELLAYKDMELDLYAQLKEYKKMKEIVNKLIGAVET